MTHSKKYLLTLAYDGTCYAGWQTQANGQAIQSLIEYKLAILCPTAPKIFGSGRTDSGVHALAQTAHFETQDIEDLTTFQYKLNCLLPLSIRILNLIEVPLDFHARFSVKQKTYRYHIYNHPVMDPFLLQKAWHIPYPLDIPTMEEAMQLLKGLHDFKAFAAKNTQGPASLDSMRCLDNFTLLVNGPLLVFELTAKGFLYKMVRNLVGCVVEIGSGKKNLSVIDQAFKEGARNLVGATAPPHGLYLQNVVY